MNCSICKREIKIGETYIRSTLSEPICTYCGMKIDFDQKEYEGSVKLSEGKE